MSFNQLIANQDLLRATEHLGLTIPTSIQREAIPGILTGQDVVAAAQTGSGKTAAFCLPLLQKWADQPSRTPGQIGVLILVPTRELATQVSDTILGLATFIPKPLKLAVVFGGLSINPQMLRLRGGADMVIATPGRLLDLLRKNALTLDSIHTVVLDEADRLLDLGFSDELTQLLRQLPTARQTVLFSATIPEHLTTLMQQFLNSPLRITVDQTPTNQPDIAQRAIVVDTDKRTPLLRHLIDTHQWKRVLVFAASRYSSELIAVKLRKARIAAEPFHGELSQGKRTQVLADFKSHRIRVIVATDVAARGIDIAQLPVVINYDLPRSSEDYLHRIGRTGRAGEQGLAVSFISTGNEAHFRLIEKRHHLQIAREQIKGFEPVVADLSISKEDKSQGGIKGKKPNKKDKLRAIEQALAVKNTEE